MKRLMGVDLRDAARELQLSDFAIRKKLAGLGAIQKTGFGWEAKQPYSQRGLLKTDTRQTTIYTEQGYPIKKIYTVVTVTGDGLNWLRDTLNTESANQ
ncbi:MAG: phage antirepressor KilAC domain-containing protein [Porticoccus sp.]|uniref:phage antirepressor KilAC domain-containing protein n=1 Tax=Porticoccus sp. TaxID=2024853 RepID=UPI0032969000